MVVPPSFRVLGNCNNSLMARNATVGYDQPQAPLTPPPLSQSSVTQPLSFALPRPQLLLLDSNAIY